MSSGRGVARRSFLRSGGMALGASVGASIAASLRPLHALDAGAQKTPKADYSLNIAPATLDIGPGVSIKTIAYNGQVPGPMLRLREGVPVNIDVTNSSTNADIVHWHGLGIDSLNDGAMEEGSPMIPPGGHLRYKIGRAHV